MFSEIESMFVTHKTVPFFNYAWLIRRMLNHFEIHDYDTYIKQIKCEKRNEYYNTMFNQLYTKIKVRGDAENYP